MPRERTLQAAYALSLAGFEKGRTGNAATIKTAMAIVSEAAGVLLAGSELGLGS